MKRRKERSGLRKRCTCNPKQWNSCRHDWHLRAKFKGQATRHKINLNDHFSVFKVITREDAEALAQRYKLEARTPEADRLTLADVAEKFIKAHPGRKHYYVAKLRLALGARRMDEITGADIEALATACQHSAKHATNGGTDAKRHLLTTARRLFNWAIRQGLAKATPFKLHDVSMISVPVSRQRDRRFVGDEEARLRAAADPWTLDLLTAALESGCRGGELRSLQFSDVQDDCLVLQAIKTKTKRKRTIPVSPTLRLVLDRRKRGPDGAELGPEAHVFGTPTGEEVSARRANDLWRAACTTATITDLHFHDLRHEFGSQLLEAGGELHEVQSTLGHTSITMTSTYLNATARGIKGAFKKLEAKRQGPSVAQ